MISARNSNLCLPQPAHVLDMTSHWGCCTTGLNSGRTGILAYVVSGVQTLCCPAKQFLTLQEQWLSIIQGQNLVLITGALLLVTAVTSVMGWEGEWLLRQSWGGSAMCKGVFNKNPGTPGVPRNPTDTRMCCIRSYPAVLAGACCSL